MIPIIDNFEDGDYTSNPTWTPNKHYGKYGVRSSYAYTGNYGLRMICSPGEEVTVLRTNTVNPHTPVTYTADIKPYLPVTTVAMVNVRYYFGRAQGTSSPSGIVKYGLRFYGLKEASKTTVIFYAISGNTSTKFYETTQGDFWYGKWLNCKIWYNPITAKFWCSVHCLGTTVTSPTLPAGTNQTHCYLTIDIGYKSNSAYFDNVSYTAEQEKHSVSGTSYVRLPAGLISIRSDSDSIGSFVRRICEVADDEYYITYSGEKMHFNLGQAGTDKSMLYSFRTAKSSAYYIGTESYPSKLANYIRLIGAGDGSVQLESHAFHATSDRTYLLADYIPGDSVLNVKSTYGFPKNGHLWVGCELVRYTGKTENTFTGIISANRFLGNVTKPYRHRTYSPVVNANYTPTAPQRTGLGSSIYYNGLRQTVVEDPSIYDQSLLDIKAERLLLRHCGVLY